MSKRAHVQMKRNDDNSYTMCSPKRRQWRFPMALKVLIVVAGFLVFDADAVDNDELAFEFISSEQEQGE